jgi:hypothetical protein
MIPMIDAMMAPGTATAMIAVGPAVIGVGLALVAGLGWMLRGTAEELDRQVARDRETRTVRVAANAPSRIAA